KSLFAEGFSQRAPEELAKLLHHQDLRVRQRAQFELARKPTNRSHLIAATDPANPLVTRLHGLWGLGQLARLHKDAQAVSMLIQLSSDSHWRIRSQAAQALGDAKAANGRDVLLKLLTDENLNVRMLAAIAVGKLGQGEDVPKLIQVLEANAAGDPYLRHGAIHGLRLIAEKSGTAEDLMKFKNHPAAEVRLGLIIALRHLRNPMIAHFLGDENPELVVETIQAINDNYIEGARAALAERSDLLGKFGQTIDYRIINAIFRVGDPKGALKLMEFAENTELPQDTRVESLFQLRRWEDPPKGDHTTGKIRPISGDRSLEDHKTAIKEGLVRLFQNSDGEVLAEALITGNHFDVAPSPETQREQFLNDANLRKVRMATLKTLVKKNDPNLVEMLNTTVSSEDPEIRKASLQELSKAAPEDALKHARRLLAEKKVYDGQFTMEVLADMEHKEAARIIHTSLSELSQQPLGIRLDIIQAAKKRKEPEIKAALKAYQQSLDASDPLAPFQVTLAGGDANRGKRVFYRHGAAQCQRCHIAEKGRDGGVAGPNLGTTEKPYEMEYLLESLVLPGARVSPGYGMVSVTRKDGSIVAGLLLEDGKDIVALKDPASGERVEYKRSEIKSMTTAMSTMPPMGQILKKEEIRDLMAYLKQLSTKK
ncbi:MAG: HEAT repeat domain-containing protein, partial [Akkermansiaceae bacterium]|nr:HEAT repeat domain-containing protein [Akkermansiaceae bacterium]